MNLGEKILTARKKAGLSQTDLADLIGVSRQSVSKWETGESSPEAGNLLPAAKALNVTVDWLLTEDDVPAPVQEDSPDWVDRLPGRVRTLIKQYGWIYCAKETAKGLLALVLINAVRIFWMHMFIPGMSLKDMFFPPQEIFMITLPFTFGSIATLIAVLFWGILWILLRKKKSSVH